jgi:hypothetical protein
MTKLSPSAYAVWNAFLDRYAWEVTTEELFAVAAVLRAAADQVVPLAFEEEYHDRNQALLLTKMVEIRQKLNAIADELETQYPD